MRPDPLEEALAELERGRRERVLVVAVVLLALAATVVVVMLGPEGTTVGTVVTAVALVIAVAAHVVSLVIRERRSVRATRALVAAQAAHAADEARERTLGALHAATRTIAATLELSDVVDRAVAAAAGLADAATAALWLRIGDGLAVAAAYGPDAPRRGTRRDVTEIDRAVIERGTALTGGRGSEWGDGAASITAPLALPERVIGVVVVQRGPTARAFGEDDRLAVALLAEHVALALRNATTLDRERQRSEAFRALVGVPPDEPDDVSRWRR